MTLEERKKQARYFLGKTVSIVVDRPLGYIHKKQNWSITYPVNYGFIPNTIAGDGEELDVYLLGVSEPVKEYECQIVAISHRDNDSEDKLIGVPAGVQFTKDEIKNAIHFQEQYFDTEIEVL